jgi:hypothetical protein
MPCVLVESGKSVRLGFLRVFPDEVSESYAEHDAETHDQDPGNYYFVDEHILSPGNGAFAWMRADCHKTNVVH